MRKNLLVAVLLLCTLYSYSQNRFRQMILGENGLSQHYLTIPDNEQIAFDASNARAFFGLDASTDLVLMNKQIDEIGQTHYRYYQTFKGIPVENTMYIVHTSGPALKGMSGVIVVNFDKAAQQRQTLAALTPAKAIKTALGIVNAKEYMWEDVAKESLLQDQSNRKLSYKPTAKLVWFSPDNDVSNKNLILAYKVDVYSKKPLSRADYFIDANTGQFLGKNDKIQSADAVGTANTEYSGTQTIHSTQSSSKYTLRDGTRGYGIITLHGDTQSGDLNYTNSSKNWNLSGADRHAMDVHYGLEKTYDFYKAAFNRNGLDNAGFTMISYVNVAVKDNAFWDGSAMNFGTRSGTNKGVTGIDVTGHELTHGVTQFTCGLQYNSESGAINESLSDIMGKSVQFYAKPSDKDWRMSNDMGWIIRNMANPNSNDQPDTYQGKFWYSGTEDNGGVHTNSGVGNFMFYLLVNGGKGKNDFGDSYKVTSIGLDKAQKIIYRSQTLYLTPTSKYSDWREACIKAATDLYGGSSSVVTQVKNAWLAVGVGRYCISYGSTYYFYINKVAFGSISNQSGDNGGYANFASKTTNLAKGSATQILITPGFYGTVYPLNWTVYIDFNKDNDFDDANETVASGSTSSTAPFNRYIGIPSAAATGKTGMRIQMSYYGGDGPCGIVVYGEVEDYSVNITNPTTLTVSNLAVDDKIPDKQNSVITVSPNPVISSNATVSYVTKNDGRIVLKMVDLYGRYVQVNNLGYQSAGKHTYTLDKLENLSAGNYYLLLEENHKVTGKAKMAVMK